MKMLRSVAVGLALSWLMSGWAFAGTSTITTKDASGTTKTFDVITDGSGNFGAMIGVCDGTALAQCAAVKAASTAAVATDPSLVVRINPGDAVATGIATIATNSAAPSPCLAATAFNTNSYSNAATAPSNCDLNGGFYVHPPANQTVNVTQVGGATLALGQTTMSAGIPVALASNQSSIPVAATLSAETTKVIGTVNESSQYPAGATAITASATGTTGATTATLAGTSGKTTYICSYSIRANATAATTVTNTVTGVITATLSHIMWVAPAASGVGLDEQIFSPCVPASATNTGIAVVSGAPGTGGNVSSTATGYQL